MVICLLIYMYHYDEHFTLDTTRTVVVLTTRSLPTGIYFDVGLHVFICMAQRRQSEWIWIAISHRSRKLRLCKILYVVQSQKPFFLTFQLLFRAMMGSDVKAVVAVDDFHLYEGSCLGGTSLLKKSYDFPLWNIINVDYSLINQGFILEYLPVSLLSRLYAYKYITRHGDWL